jgi:IS5 family transposase
MKPQSKQFKKIMIIRKLRQDILNKKHTTGINTREMSHENKLLEKEQSLRKKLNPKELEEVSNLKRVR